MSGFFEDVYWEVNRLDPMLLAKAIKNVRIKMKEGGLKND